MTGPTDHDSGADRPAAPAEPSATEPTDVPEAPPAGAAPGPDVPEDVPEEEPDPLAVATAERDEYLDALRRLQAEFDNYRKRVARQQAEAGERAAAVLVEKLLPVLDTLDLAAAHLGDEPGPDGTALLQASAQLNDVLAKEGLERIEPAGLPFDPTAHEAVGHEPAPEPEPPAVGDGTGDGVGDGADETVGNGEGAGAGDGGAVVVRVMRAGYRWRGAVVRPAMVTVRG